MVQHRSRRRNARRICGLAAAAATITCVHVSAPAIADGGFLADAGCTGLSPPCGGGLPGGSDVVDHPTSLVVSADGQSAYAIGFSYSRSLLVRFRRASDGALTFSGCISDVGGSGCTGTPSGIHALDGPRSILVSGSDIYVAEYKGVSHFRAVPGGGLRFADCVGTSSAGCRQQSNRSDALSDPRDLAIAPGGTQLYVATTDGVVELRRNSGGDLQYVSCVNGPGCASSPQSTGPVCPSDGCLAEGPLGLPRKMAISPDGHSLYVVSGLDRVAGSAVAHFRIRVDGRISYADCIGQFTVGCTPMPASVRVLEGDHGIAVAPSGDVYVLGDHGLAHFHSGADGALSFADCVGSDEPGCAALPGSADGIIGGYSLAVSPDGGDLYASALNTDLLDFRLDGATGAPRFSSCIGDGPGCALLSLDDLRGDELSVASDGSTLYYPEDGFIQALARLGAPATRPGSPPSASSGGVIQLDSHSARVQPHVSAGGSPYKYWVEYGTTPNYGAVSPATNVPAGADEEPLGIPLAPLTPSTTYHYRVVAADPAGMVRGEDRSFTTPRIEPSAPSIEPDPALGLTPTTAMVETAIETGFGPTHYTVEYGRTTSYGSRVEGDLPPLERVRFTRALTGLTPGTAYHFHFTATNTSGSTSGLDFVFETPLVGALPTAPGVYLWSVGDVTAHTATLRATLATFPEAVTYHYEIAHSADGPWNPLSSAVQPAHRSARVDEPVTGLAAGSSYFVRIVARTATQQVTSEAVPFATPTS